MGNLDKRLWEYNGILKENDEIYRDASKEVGLSDCAFWILYVLREERGAVTQSEICSMLYQPKQTVNSALKKLENEGYIQLARMQDRRSKEVQLTEKGEVLAGQTVDRIIAAEHQALAGLSDEEQELFLGLFRKYTHLLRENMKHLKNIQEEL